MSDASSKPKIDPLWAEVRPNSHGLVPCVVQDLRTRAVLMVAWVSQEALRQSVETGWATYYSRSRRELWVKGATSGNRQRLIQVRLDCDSDTLHYLVEARLPACHEGTDSCFSKRRVKDRWVREPEALRESHESSVIDDLETVIDARSREPKEGKPSYTRQLLEKGPEAIVSKVREESEELAVALEREVDDRVISEGADLLYHLAVALKQRKLSFRSVFSELEARFGTSGLEEKAARAGENLYADAGPEPPPENDPNAG